MFIISKGKRRASSACIESRRVTFKTKTNKKRQSFWRLSVYQMSHFFAALSRALKSRSPSSSPASLCAETEETVTTISVYLIGALLRTFPEPKNLFWWTTSINKQNLFSQKLPFELYRYNHLSYSSQPEDALFPPLLPAPCSEISPTLIKKNYEKSR